MTTQQYQQDGEHFLTQAREELAAGDLPQASATGRGNHRRGKILCFEVKAIAAQRGWEHNRHRHYHRIVSRLRAETGDGDIRHLFEDTTIEAPCMGHFNENALGITEEDVADAVDGREVLLDKLMVMLTSSSSLHVDEER